MSKCKVKLLVTWVFEGEILPDIQCEKSEKSGESKNAIYWSK